MTISNVTKYILTSICVFVICTVSQNRPSTIYGLGLITATVSETNPQQILVEGLENPSASDGGSITFVFAFESSENQTVYSNPVLQSDFTSLFSPPLLDGVYSVVVTAETDTGITASYTVATGILFDNTGPSVEGVTAASDPLSGTDGVVRVTWNGLDTTEISKYYTQFRFSGSSGAWITFEFIPESGKNYIDVTEISNANEYEFQLYFEDSLGNPSNPVQAGTARPYGNFNSFVSPEFSNVARTSFDLTWNAPSPEGQQAEYYTVHHGLSGGSVFVQSDPVTEPTYPVSGLLADTNYDVYVKAYADSGRIQVTSGTILVSTTANDPPVGLEATQANLGSEYNEIDITGLDNITDTDGVSAVYVYYDTTNTLDIGGTSVASNNLVGVSTHKIRFLDETTDYYVWVQAIDTLGAESVYDVTVGTPVTTGLGLDIFAPISSTSVLPYTLNGTEVTLDWTGIFSDERGIDSYGVSFGFTGQGQLTSAVTSEITTRTYDDLVEGETYTFAVRAIDGANNASTVVSTGDVTIPVTTAPELDESWWALESGNVDFITTSAYPDWFAFRFKSADAFTGGTYAVNDAVFTQSLGSSWETYSNWADNTWDAPVDATGQKLDHRQAAVAYMEANGYGTFQGYRSWESAPGDIVEVTHGYSGLTIEPYAVDASGDATLGQYNLADGSFNAVWETHAIPDELLGVAGTPLLMGATGSISPLQLNSSTGFTKVTYCSQIGWGATVPAGWTEQTYSLGDAWLCATTVVENGAFDLTQTSTSFLVFFFEPFE